LLPSVKSSDSPEIAADLLRLDRLAGAYPVERAELRASPKQLRFQRAYLTRTHPETGKKAGIFVAMGGNRSGKTYVCGWLCLAKWIRDYAPDGAWVWCVGQTLDRSIGGQQRELWNALPRWMFGDQTWSEKIGFGAHRKVLLKTERGKVLVEFRSADQDPSTFEQAKLDGVWCDERLSEDIYNRILPRIVDKDGFILYSDIPEQWWQFERLKEAPPEAGVFFQHFTMHDNEPNLPPGAIEQVSGRMTVDERKQRIGGDFVVMEGVVYREFLDVLRPDGHLVRPFAIPKEWPKWRLIDYGGSSPTACPWVTIAPNEQLYAYREHYTRGKGVLENARLIREASHDEKYVATFIDPAAFDTSPANLVSIADQYRQAGIPCLPWPRVNIMGEHAMTQKVKFRLENRTLFVFENLVNLRREFRSWKYKTDKDGKPLAADAFENDNNHLLDGLKGFLGTNPCHATRNTIVPVQGD
jgi:hypothetical protein